MPIKRRIDGRVEYDLVTQGSSRPAQPTTRATNRQRKLLRFFNVPFSPNISVGAAGWEIAAIMSREECREEWRRYLFLTSDFDSDTDALWPFDTTTLLSVEIPENWSVGHALQHFREELAADIISDESPFDRPQPVVIFSNRTFIFTGNFAFGQRRACQQAVSARGGLAPNHKTVSRHTDYLVIGTKGSTAWKKGAYGNKIESAVLARREHGVPAIISEEHWVAALAPA